MSGPDRLEALRSLKKKGYTLHESLKFLSDSLTGMGMDPVGLREEMGRYENVARQRADEFGTLDTNVKVRVIKETTL